MRNVVIGLLGSTLGQGFSRKRWEYWRPSIGVCMHEDLLVDELTKYLAKFLITWNDIHRLQT